MLKRLIREVEHQLPTSNCVSYEYDKDVQILGGMHVNIMTQATLVLHASHLPSKPDFGIKPSIGRVTRIESRGRRAPPTFGNVLGEPIGFEVLIEIDLTQVEEKELYD